VSPLLSCLAAVPADGGTVCAETATLLARMGATVWWRRGTSGEVNRNDGVWVKGLSLPNPVKTLAHPPART